MFKITDGKGFQIRFDNGWTISVQFGAGNYCEHYHGEFGSESRRKMHESHNAECAAWNRDNKWLPISEHDDVKGWMSPDEVLALMNRVAALAPDYIPPTRESLVED